MGPYSCLLVYSCVTPALWPNQNGFLLMRTSCVQNGDLYAYLVEKGRLEEAEARRYFQQIVRSVLKSSSHSCCLFALADSR